MSSAPDTPAPFLPAWLPPVCGPHPSPAADFQPAVPRSWASVGNRARGLQTEPTRVEKPLAHKSSTPTSAREELGLINRFQVQGSIFFFVFSSFQIVTGLQIAETAARLGVTAGHWGGGACGRDGFLALGNHLRGKAFNCLASFGVPYQLPLVMACRKPLAPLLQGSCLSWHHAGWGRT